MQSPSPRLVLPLIFLLLMLSLAGVALLVNGFLRNPDTERIASLCAETVLASIPKPEACPEPEVITTNTQTIQPSIQSPGLRIPANWSATRHDTLVENGLRTVIDADQTMIVYCDACDGPNPPIRIITEPIAEDLITTDPDTFVTALYADTPDAVTTQTQEPGGDGHIYTTTGTHTGLLSGPFTDIIFIGTTHWSRVFISESPLLPKGGAGYTDIITSLDFSLIP